MVWVRSPGYGEAEALARLGEMALRDQAAAKDMTEFGRILAGDGGRSPVPCGHGQALVGGIAADAIAGLVYAVPPVRLIGAYASAGRDREHRHRGGAQM